MASPLRAPLDEIARLVLSLKLRCLHLLDKENQLDQIDILRELYENELARLTDLRTKLDAGYLGQWIDIDITQAEAKLKWLDKTESQIDQG
jgi:hypothetical protein